ncbi:MAG: bis(5'-nucleosyl)-tetraphosphatase (symmetrical) YqeK [Chloroflexi bacterium]|nr:bis(5'-nucleosyl)-tetraphosphatase (symmetrical) YqeK [Chloroflexota bacterium]
MITDQIAAVREELLLRPPGLVRHVGRVLDEALPLARYWLADEERVELAVWGHDLFRSEPPAEQIRLAGEVGVAIDADSRDYPILLHGPIAAAVLRERFRITDEETLMAVRDHTSGLAHMSLLAKILLISDKIEKKKRRGVPELADIRRIARRDLDTAILCWADWRWTVEARERYRTQASHWRARCHWVEEHHRDIDLPGRVTRQAFTAAARKEGLVPPRG